MVHIEELVNQIKPLINDKGSKLNQKQINSPSLLNQKKPDLISLVKSIPKPSYQNENMYQEINQAIGYANSAFKALANPCQRYADASSAVLDFAQQKSFLGAVNEALRPKLSDQATMLISAIQLCNSGVVITTTTVLFAEVGAAIAGAVLLAKVLSLLDSIGEYVSESHALKDELKAAYDNLSKAVNTFNLRHCELFELIEKAGGKTSGKEIKYPANYSDLQSTFGFKFF